MSQGRSRIAGRVFALLVAALVVGWSLLGNPKGTLVVLAGLAAGFAVWPAIQARRDAGVSSDGVTLALNVAIALVAFLTLLLFLQFEGGLPVLLGAGVLGGALVGSQFRKGG
jgi:hypothetical protein